MQMDIGDPWKGRCHQPLAGGKTRARDSNFLSREPARGHKNLSPNLSPPNPTLSPHNASKWSDARISSPEVTILIWLIGKAVMMGSWGPTMPQVAPRHCKPKEAHLRELDEACLHPESQRFFLVRLNNAETTASLCFPSYSSLSTGWSSERWQPLHRGSIMSLSELKI